MRYWRGIIKRSKMFVNRNRYFGSKTDGNSFELRLVLAVFQKGQVFEGYDPYKLRIDQCRAIILLQDYGKLDSQYGWEIDHIYPVSRGGTDDLANLQPLQWQNNRRKSDNLFWSCAVMRKAA